MFTDALKGDCPLLAKATHHLLVSHNGVTGVTEEDFGGQAVNYAKKRQIYSSFYLK